MIYGVSMIGANTIIDWAKSLERAFMVENVKAEEVVTNLTWQEEVRNLLKDYGIDLVKAEKIIYCESRWNPQAINYNKGSVDYGLWQINNFYHPEVSKDCALDAGCSTMEAIRIIKTKGFGEWSCNRLIK